MDLRQIKDQYAKEMAFENWQHLVAKIKSESKFFTVALSTIMMHNDEATKLYAEECCKASLKEASKNACIEPKGMMTRVDKKSIDNFENIILL